MVFFIVAVSVGKWRPDNPALNEICHLKLPRTLFRPRRQLRVGIRSADPQFERSVIGSYFCRSLASLKLRNVYQAHKRINHRFELGHFTL